MTVKGNGKNNSHSGGFLLLQTEDWAKATVINAKIEVSVLNILKDDEILNEWTGYGEEESDEKQRRAWAHMLGAKHIQIQTVANLGNLCLLAS